MGGFVIFFVVLFVVIILISLRQVNEYQRGVKFTMGRYSGTIKAGWRIVIPIFQQMRKVDLRVKAVDVPDQKVITRDNVSVIINAVLYYKIRSAEHAVLEVENYAFATSQLAQTTMRNVAGEVELDELLTQRDKLSLRIKQIVDKATDPWGIAVESVELKDINLPADMERTIAKQAEAERERRAVIIKAQGEVAAAENMAKAGRMLAESPGGLHLRTLQSLNDISSDQSNTIVYTIPIELLQGILGKFAK